jgi:hypothetical protein
VTAIDVLIDLDATMKRHATAANARLLKGFPQGFALDATHYPHLTCLQAYVRTSELDRVDAAIEKILAGESPKSWKLTAYRYDAGPWDGLMLAGIYVQPTGELLSFQKKLIEALSPFTAKSGTWAAFFSPKSDAAVDQRIIEYVAAYGSDGTGPKFKPHVTIGVASPESLGTLLDGKFDPFVWSPEGVSVYQLGRFGTARKKLKAWSVR